MIYNQDCLTWLHGQADHTIDIVVTSPPYNKNIAYNSYQDRRSDYLDWIGEINREICRVLKPQGHFFLNLAGSAQDPLLPYRVADAVPWRIQNHIVWAKAIEFGGHIHGRSTVNIRAQYRLPNGHETVWHFTHKGSTPIDITASGVPYRPEFAEDNFRRTGRKTRPTTTCWHIPYETTGYMGQDSKELKGERGHPAIFPRELVRHCLRVAGAKPGLRVYDPFAGTGTTLVVAREFGCVGIGTEIDPDYFAFIQQRLANAA